MWRRPKRPASDFQEEIRAHLELEADELRSEGVAEGDAPFAARKSFGNVRWFEERFYERSRLVFLDHLIQDLRYGLRMMRNSPGFTAAVVGTLALGMGANTAIFSLIDAALLRTLPVLDPSGLYFLNNAGSREVGGSPPYPCFERFRAQATSFTGISAYAENDFSIRIDGPLEQVDGAVVSGNYYEVLGIRPAAGRLLAPGDDRLSPPVAVISYDFWQRRFAGKPEAMGRTFSLDGIPGKFTIVGVTAKGFESLDPGRRNEVTMPFTIAGASVLRSTSSWFFQAIGRLKPGVTPRRAQAEIDPIFQTFMNQYPPSSDARRDYFHQMELTPASRGLDELRKRFTRPLWALMTVVGLVLLIGCANITNLLLARAAKREREFAVRMAIGAGRGRLFRQLLVETGVLFAAGALAGVALAWWGARAVLAFFAAGARPIRLDIHWDWRVMAFTAGLSLLATLLFGAAPVVRAVRSNPHAAMKDGSRSTASRSRVELGRVLVAAQIALSLILLVGAALFLRTLANLYSNAAAFHADGVILFSMHLPDPAYHASSARIALWDRILAQVRRLPVVRTASISSLTPFDGRTRGVGFLVPGFEPRSDDDRGIALITVSEDYFKTLSMRLLEGRDFTPDDRDGTPRVAILNQSARRHFFNGRDPLGTVVTLMGQTPYRLTGVVEDARQQDIRKEAVPAIFIPLRQPLDMGARMTLSVRIAGDSGHVIADVERIARSLGPDVRILRTGTLARQLNESLLQERLVFTLAAAFGILALILSAVGLYGVLSYSVARRTPEIGIRMTLGARPGQVTWSVLRETLALVAVGIAAGVPLSMYLARIAGSLLYGVTATDITAQLGPAVLLTAVACLASYLPAYRAGRIDPAVALRSE